MDNLFDRSLSKSEFEEALHKGLGRAYIYIEKYGDKDVKDIFRDACLYNYAYDQQVEELRCDWYYSMIKLTQNESYYENEILDALDVYTDELHIIQLAGLVKMFALKGSTRAKNVLYKIFEHSVDHDDTFIYDIFIGEEEILELDGEIGFLFMAEKIGKKIYINSPDDISTNLYIKASEIYGEKYINELLLKNAKDNLYIQAYINKACEKYEPIDTLTKEELKIKARKELGVETIIDDLLSNKENEPYRFRRFGLNATENELKIIFNHILQETDELKLIKLLTVFKRRSIPFVHEYIFDLILSENVELSQAAIECLSNVKDSSINSFEVKVIENSLMTNVYSILPLFKNNYEIGNFKLIQGILRNMPDGVDAFDLHNIGLDILDICDNDITELNEILIWLYEKTPCSFCRMHVVDKLVKWKLIPEYIINESKYDCSEDTRMLIENFLSP